MSIKNPDERINLDTNVFELVSTTTVDENILHIEVSYPIHVDKITAINQFEEMVRLFNGDDGDSGIEITAWRPTMFEKGYEV